MSDEDGAQAEVGVAEERPSEAEEEVEYAERGSHELAGSVAVAWTEDLFSVSLGPSLGWFVRDGLEVTGLLRFQYLKPEGADGSMAGAVVVEPSYHAPIDGIFAFGGLGFGAGFAGDRPDLELIPRAGLNLPIGPSALVTPAVRVPILFVADQDPAVGLVLEASMGTVF